MQRLWVSSIVLGLLSSVPQIAEHHFHPAEAAVNAGITATFAVLMWYFIVFMLSPAARCSPGSRAFRIQN